MQETKDATVDATLQERNNSHGDYTEQAHLGECIRQVFACGKNWKNMTSVQRDALLMISVKISRILSGSPHVADHWHDICGYSRLVERELLSKADAAASPAP